MTEKELFELTKKITSKYNINPNFAYAVATVESNNNGYDKDGYIKVRFEPHVFAKYLRTSGQPVNVPINGFNRKAMLAASEVNEKYALMSTSFGMYQIMGFNYKLIDYDNVYSMVEGLSECEENQIEAFCKFVVNNKLTTYVNNKNYNKFAYHYNGPNYCINVYNKKLELAYLNSLKLGQ